VRQATSYRASRGLENRLNTNAAKHSTRALENDGCIAIFSAFTQSLAEVEVWGCDDWWYTATLACSANAKTNTHADSSNSRQQVELKGLSGAVRGGISTMIIRGNPTLVSS
jgi:hypothetical protein